MLEEAVEGRDTRRAYLEEHGYPAYTTSPGWLGYSDEKLATLCREAVAEGYRTIKLKVGLSLDDDVRRLAVARDAVGPEVRLAVDANQRWDVAGRRALDVGAGALRPRVDRGADQPGRHPRPRGDPRRDRRPGLHRRAHAEPDDVQAVHAGRRGRPHPDRRDPCGRREREPRDPAARPQVRCARLPARRWRGAVRARPAPGDGRLRGHLRRTWRIAPWSTSTTCTSTSSTRSASSAAGTGRPAHPG